MSSAFTRKPRSTRRTSACRRSSRRRSSSSSTPNSISRESKMTLKLYAHPLSSYCHKALIALYENGVDFQQVLVGDPTRTNPKDWEEFKAMWPIGKFPVLKDEGRDWFVPEATIIIEYVEQHYPGKARLIPTDPDLARRVRMQDRFFDN